MQNIGMKFKRAVIGGSFNPIHLGHLHLFHNISSLLSLETLCVIPTYLSNFKRDSRPVSFDERVAMLKLAILDYKELFPSDNMDIKLSTIEGERGGVSYTSDTIRALYSEYEERGKVNFCMGDDLLSSLDNWNDFEYLRENVRFICFTRDKSEHVTHGAEVIFINSPIFVASSSAIREGREELLSKRVKEYVDEHKLYRAL